MAGLISKDKRGHGSLDLLSTVITTSSGKMTDLQRRQTILCRLRSSSLIKSSLLTFSHFPFTGVLGGCGRIANN